MFKAYTESVSTELVTLRNVHNTLKSTLRDDDEEEDNTHQINATLPQLTKSIET